mgnify:CR=1 FL=1
MTLPTTLLSRVSIRPSPVHLEGVARITGLAASGIASPFSCQRHCTGIGIRAPSQCVQNLMQEICFPSIVALYFYIDHVGPRFAKHPHSQTIARKSYDTVLISVDRVPFFSTRKLNADFTSLVNFVSLGGIIVLDSTSWSKNQMTSLDCGEGCARPLGNCPGSSSAFRLHLDSRHELDSLC